MSTPKDHQRVRAFRAFAKHVGGAAGARARTGVGQRSIERMIAGKQPPPVGLLSRCAGFALADGNHELAAALQDAARPVREVDHA